MRLAARQVFLLLSILLVLTSPTLAGPLEDCAAYARLGVPGQDGDLLCRTGHLLAHDSVRKTPIWVAERVTAEKATSTVVPREAGSFRIGLDINPLACLIAETKAIDIDTDTLDRASLHLLACIKDRCFKGRASFPNIDHWFSKNAQQELFQIREAIKSLQAEYDSSVIKFLQVCFSSIIRRSSYADPRMAKTYKSKRVHDKIRKGWVPTPIHNFETALLRNIQSLKLLYEQIHLEAPPPTVFQADARHTVNHLRTQGVEQVDFIVTSPPYINAQDYFRSYKLELWWLDLVTLQDYRTLRRQIVGTENTSHNNFAIVSSATVIPHSESRGNSPLFPQGAVSYCRVLGPSFFL